MRNLAERNTEQMDLSTTITILLTNETLLRTLRNLLSRQAHQNCVPLPEKYNELAKLGLVQMYDSMTGLGWRSYEAVILPLGRKALLEAEVSLGHEKWEALIHKINGTRPRNKWAMKDQFPGERWLEGHK